MENEYDYYNRIIGVKYNGIRLFSYVYNSDGLVSRYIDNANHKTYNYNYDMLGRVQRMDVSDGSNISYTYNNLNQVTGIKYGFNGITKSSTYTYKKGGIPDLTTYPNGATKTHVLNGQVQLGETVLTTTGTNQWKTDCIYYTVIDDGVSYTTNLVGDYTFSEIGRTISYTYDGSGNIATKADTKYSTTNKIEYFYDELNQLIRENDPVANKTTTYVYDNGGNILEKREYDYTTGTLGTPTKITEFRYASTQWKDLLTSYTGHAITYDAVGNPLKFGDITMTWERGRKLSTMTFADGSTASYKYNADGIRTQKTVNGVTTDYFLEGSTIVAQKTGNDVIWYYFDGDGTRDAIEYNGNVYYYMYNPQGDVIGLFDDDLNVVVEYTYDSWGKIISTTGSLKDTLGKANPFRYRGYYYDEESGFYYLNSRYYYPEIGRFINADGYVQTGQGILDKNMFAYCANNPIIFCDPSGCLYTITFPATGNSGLYSSSDSNYYATYENGTYYVSESNLIISNTTNNNSEPDHPDYKPPKGGGRKVKNPNGNGRGWLGHDGGVWVWTPKMHGDPGWTVQYPNGKHKHAYPGGGVRSHYQINQNMATSAIMLIGGVLFTGLLIVDNLTGIGVADDALLAGSMSCVVYGMSVKQVCTICGEEYYGY